MVASESVALTGCCYTLVRDVAPGEAIFIDIDCKLSSRQCADNPALTPCAFEYVYFARPDSMMDGVSIYDARLNMGEYLGDNVAKSLRLGEIDVVMPIPDSSLPSAMQLADRLALTHRQGLLNRKRGVSGKRGAFRGGLRGRLRI